MKRIQNEDLKYEPTSGQNIILGCKSHMGAILTYMATVRLFKTEKQVKMAKNSTFCLLQGVSPETGRKKTTYLSLKTL